LDGTGIAGAAGLDGTGIVGVAALDATGISGATGLDAAGVAEVAGVDGSDFSIVAGVDGSDVSIVAGVDGGNRVVGNLDGREAADGGPVGFTSCMLAVAKFVAVLLVAAAVCMVDASSFRGTVLAGPGSVRLAFPF